MAKRKPTPIDLSIIVVCHAEGILLHKTLLSIQRSLVVAPHLTSELLIHIDNPTDDMARYAARLPDLFPEAIVFTNHFKDPGLSRDFCIQRANGRYIALIDGDDLMSENWLGAAVAVLDERPYGSTVAHSAMTVEFGGFTAVVHKQGEIDLTTDTLLNVWSGRWNSIIIAPTPLLQRLRYPANDPGYGFEDWLLSCRILSEQIHNILIPETVMFVRRKETNSVWDAARASRSVLAATPLLSFSSVRSMKLPGAFLPDDVHPQASRRRLRKIKRFIQKYPQVHRLALGSHRRLRHLASRLSRMSHTAQAAQTAVPAWLEKEWRAIHGIERQLFPDDHLLKTVATHHSITPVHYRLGRAYHQAVTHTRHDSYDYILFVPWLIAGGADKFAIDYANTIAQAHPNKRVLVMATNYGAASPRSYELDASIDFIPFGEIAAQCELEPEHQQRLLEQLVEQSHVSHLHILNSELAYDFVRLHPAYIRGTRKKVIATSFSQSSDPSGRVFGFSHTHTPYIYELCSAITTDNTAVRSMWIDLYGFDGDQIMIHRPKINPEACQSLIPKASPRQPDAPLRVLWAARLAPEKLPQIVANIAQRMKHSVHIDMYGTSDPSFNTAFLEQLPDNVTYHGAFSQFFSLPLHDYDAYLYTSLFDGLPNALIEATVAGLPIVASAVGGVPEFIGEDRGILVNDPHDIDGYAAALDTLATSPELRQKLVSRASDELSRGYTPESHRQAILKMLEKVDYL